jgi:hypothetical protein
MRALGSKWLAAAWVCACTNGATGAVPFQIQDLGLRDALHGEGAFSEIVLRNDAGPIAGYSTRFQNGSNNGRDVWLYAMGTAIPVGLNEPEYGGPNGFKYGEIEFLSASGVLAGYSNRNPSSATVNQGRSAWLHSSGATIRLGFHDSQHTGNQGFHYDRVNAINDSGQAIGMTQRFTPAGALNGSDAWLHANGVIVQLGLTDPPYVGSDDAQNSEALLLNSAGQVAGASARYTPAGVQDGQAVWFYSAGATARIGFFDAAHTSASGRQFSDVRHMNQSGQLGGHSLREGSAGGGQSAWLHSGGATVRLGLFDTAHTQSDGAQHSEVFRLLENGAVAGYSVNFPRGSSSYGYSAWIYQAGGLTRLGLIDSDHVRPDGYHDSRIQFITESGFAAGSTLYQPTSPAEGLSSWLFDGLTTHRIGLTDSAHTSAGSTQFSVVRALNDLGQAAGESFHYSGGGTSAWVYSQAVTSRIGLTDAGHTGTSGRQIATVLKLNTAGQVVGYSTQFNASGEEIGQSAWARTGGPTARIGLIDSLHTRSDGGQISEIEFQNAAGDVVGTSGRYFAGGSLGISGWFFDNNTEQTHPLVFSTRNDGYAYTDPLFLSEAGVVLGRYDLFSGQSSLGSRAFAWELSDGFVDLGSWVEGGLASAGWFNLSSAFGMNDQGQIIGYGSLIGRSSGQMGFLLTSIPEPLMLPGVSVLAIAGMRTLGRRCRLIR